MRAPPGVDAGQAAGRQAIRIVLADDHRVVRRGLQLVLEAEDELTVVAQAGDVASARASVREHVPDVLVLDLNMPGGASLRLITELRGAAPETQIVVLTMEDDPALVGQARRAGALGYVLKESAETDLVHAVRAAAAGEVYLNRQLASRLIVDRMINESPD